jgi:hypothetical protein
MTPSWSAGVGYTVCQTVKPPFIQRDGHMAICPGAEAVRGWRALNRSTVCTVGAVAPGAGFLRLNERVSQVHSRRVRIVEPETTSLKRETSRRPNFFIFRPIEVPKEPRQGFWDAGKPLEQSVCQFEHCKTCF